MCFAVGEGLELGSGLARERDGVRTVPGLVLEQLGKSGDRLRGRWRCVEGTCACQYLGIADGRHRAC